MQSDMINPPDGFVGIAMSRPHDNDDDVSAHTEQLLTGGPDALDSCTELHESCDHHHSVMKTKHLQPPASLQNHSGGQWSTVNANGCDQKSPTSPSASSSLPRRFPIPPSLKFEGTTLPDIGEEDDVRSQGGGGGNGVVTTPVTSSVGQLTPQLADDASTIYTIDDESECASGHHDLSSRAEKRLESAKQRLTDMEGNLSLAHPPSFPSKQSDGSAVVPSSSRSEKPPQQQKQQNNSKETPQKQPEAKHTPPISEFVLTRSVLNYGNNNAQFEAARQDQHSSSSGSPSKAKQRTTSLAEALMRKNAQKQEAGQLNENASSKEDDMRGDSRGSSPEKSYLNRTEDRHSMPIGSYRNSHMKAKTNHGSTIARASSASELQPPSYLKPTHSQTPYRSRSSLTIQTGGMGTSLRPAKPLGSVPRKQSSSTIPCEPSYIHRSRSQDLRQSQQHKVHVTPSASTLSSRYRHSRTPSIGDSSRMLSLPTDPASRAEQVRDLKDQVTDLKIKISTLKVKTQADSLRRRKDEHATKNSKEPTERPSLFTDARQTSNGNGFMNHANYTKAQKGIRISGEEPLGILLGPVDREKTSKTAHQNRGQHPSLGSADTNQKCDRLPFDKLPPLQEMNSPQETGTQSPGAFWDNPQSPNQQCPIKCRSPEEGPVASDSMDTLQYDKFGSSEFTLHHRKGHRGRSDSHPRKSESAGQNRIGCNNRPKMADVKEEVEEPDSWDGGDDESGDDIANVSSSTRNSASMGHHGPKSSGSKKQHKGIFKRASSAGDVYQHRRVTWSDDLEHDDDHTATEGNGSRRHVRRSTSAATIAATSYQDRLDCLRRAHSNTLHQKSKRFHYTRRNSHWTSSDSESERALQSDHTDDCNVTTPHEEREDAFDYEHFLLHTAVGDFAIPNDLETSVTEMDDGEEDQPRDDSGVADEGSAEGGVGGPKDCDDKDDSSDHNSVGTAKGERNDDQSSSRAPSRNAPSRTQRSAVDPDLLAPTTARTPSPNASHESLSTIMTFETAREGRDSTDLDEATSNEKPVKHRRNSSDKTITGHHASGSLGSSGAVRYKVSSIRNASSPTVLIQPHPFDSRASSRASVNRCRSRGSNPHLRTVDRGVQTSPERPKDQPAKAVQSTLPTDSGSVPSYSTPRSKMATLSLRLQMETGSLSSLSSTRTTDSGTSASASSVTGSTGMTGMTAPAPAKPSEQARSSLSQHQLRSVLGSPLSTDKSSVISPRGSATGTPLPDLQEVVASLISTAASRYAPPSVVNNNGSQPSEHVDSAQNEYPDPSLTQMEEEDLARISALFTSVGQLAFRLQVSLAEQPKQWPLPPNHSPSTPSSLKRPGTAQSNTSIRATHVLRERLEAAKRLLDGKLEIPSRQK